MFVALYLNLERIRVSDMIDMADAVRIGMGQATVPDSWIEMLTADQTERAVWRLQELQKRY